MHEGKKGSLSLSRRLDESTLIFADSEATDAELASAVRQGILVTVAEVTGGMKNPKVILRFKAPHSLKILREELVSRKGK